MEHGYRSFVDIAKLRKLSPHTKIVVFTVSEDEEDVYEAAQQGVDGYILKSTPFVKLESYLLGINSGKKIISESLASKLFTIVSRNIANKPLSQRESEILILIGEGCSNQEIAERLHITVNTVKTHLNKIMKKMNVKSRYQLALHHLKKSHL
jgi:DNA-binding NarL/FixJ family response regulator